MQRELTTIQPRAGDLLYGLEAPRGKWLDALGVDHTEEQWTIDQYPVNDDDWQFMNVTGIRSDRGDEAGYIRGLANHKYAREQGGRTRSNRNPFKTKCKFGLYWALCMQPIKRVHFLLEGMVDIDKMVDKQESRYNSVTAAELRWVCRYYDAIPNRDDCLFFWASPSKLCEPPWMSGPGLASWGTYRHQYVNKSIHDFAWIEVSSRRQREGGCCTIM